MDNSTAVALTCGFFCISYPAVLLLGWLMGKGKLRFPYRLVKNGPAKNRPDVALRRPGDEQPTA